MITENQEGGFQFDEMSEGGGAESATPRLSIARAHGTITEVRKQQKWRAMIALLLPRTARAASRDDSQTRRQVGAARMYVSIVHTPMRVYPGSCREESLTDSCGILSGLSIAKSTRGDERWKPLGW